MLDGFDKILSASKEPYAMEKAIAHYLCRELIEDLHTNYNISQEEMKAINIKCVDRAYAVIKALDGDQLAYRGLLSQAVLADNLDDPKEGELKDLQLVGKILKEEEDNRPSGKYAKIWEMVKRIDEAETHTDFSGVLHVSVREVADVFNSIPKGYVTTWEAVREHFKAIYNVTHLELELSKAHIIDNFIPYHRAVSVRGYLQDYGQYYTKENQRLLLENEGIRFDDRNRVIGFKERLWKIR